MDSQAEDAEIDAAVEAWMAKEATEQGVDREALAQSEFDAWNRWKANPTQQEFAQLYQSHKPVIFSAGQKYLSSTTLPKAAVRSDMMRNYIHALDTFDPSRGAALKTHIFREMQHTGRYLTKYQNVGKIPDDRANVIGLLQNRLGHLRESLGREPSNAELADDMTTSLQEIGELNKKMSRLTPKTVETLRRELRRDLLAEAPGGETSIENSKLLDHLIFMHGSLTPEQQVVLEHTYSGFGKPVIEDAMQLGPTIGMSPQKVRALRKQIGERAKRYY